MATEADLQAWTAASGRDWDQLCQALMWNYCDQFGSIASTPPSAIEAYYASNIESYDAHSAPPGSFIYFDIGAYGHVALSVDDSNAMGSGHLQTVWGINAGLSLIDYYVSQTGATPLGWSWDNAGNTIDYGTGGGGGGTDYAYGLTADCQSALQAAMNVNGPPYYSGPVDGAFGENSVKGMQQWLKDLGYLEGDYDVDGIPGPAYGLALQQLAYDRGVPPYRGPMDGAPGEATSTSLIGWANSLEPDPEPPDPEPEPEIPSTPSGTYFGIDVGSSQAAFDFAAFAAAGGRAVVIKAGGANADDSPYIAPHYATQLAAARAAGLEIGHYWFNGRANGLTPTTSAQYFVQIMGLEPGDVIALDVEAETATSTAAYTPAETLEFVTELERLLPGAKVLIYLNAAAEASEDWTAVVDAGHPLWVASWGSNNGTIPAETPVPSHWADWTIWQYSSTVVVPGQDAGLDGDVIRDDAWSMFGYVDEPDPEPEPPDDDLASTMSDFFGDLAALGTQYQGRVDPFQALITPPAAAEPPTDHEPRHARRRGLWHR